MHINMMIAIETSALEPKYAAKLSKSSSFEKRNRTNLFDRAMPLTA